RNAEALAHLSKACGEGAYQGTTGGCESPMASAKPNMRFMFCTAWPAAPFTRLSITDRTTSVSPLPEFCGGRCSARRHMLAARTAHAGLGVGDEVVAIDDTALDERQEAKLHRGRITAGIRHQPRTANGLAVHLAQAVDRFARELGRRVLGLVPAFPFDDVAD